MNEYVWLSNQVSHASTTIVALYLGVSSSPLWLLDCKVYLKFPLTLEKTIENWNTDHLEIGTHHSVTRIECEHNASLALKRLPISCQRRLWPYHPPGAQATGENSINSTDKCNLASHCRIILHQFHFSLGIVPNLRLMRLGTIPAIRYDSNICLLLTCNSSFIWSIATAI